MPSLFTCCRYGKVAIVGTTDVIVTRGSGLIETAADVVKHDLLAAFELKTTKGFQASVVCCCDKPLPK